MDHPSIINALKNAKERCLNKNDDPVIYLSFKRPAIFYTDTYYILVGTASQVWVAIDKLYEDVSRERREFPRADYINLLDTPFDTWCGCGNCAETTVLKCSSHWTYEEHASPAELTTYLKNIPFNEYSPSYTVEYL
jgi:hypothetical protein